jgi:FkbM family methyltransferase
MFSRTLARIAAVLPSSFKMRVPELKPAYTFLMGLGQRTVRISTGPGVLNWKIDRFVSQEIILGTYEPQMQEQFRQFLRPGHVVYDVGAHVGFHSIFCALLVGPSGKVIAFEPNPETRSSLMNQISANPGLPISVMACALTDHCGTVRLDTSTTHLSCAVAEGGNLAVEATTIDALVDQGQILPPNLIKIDVEGHDAYVIKGAAATIQKYQPVVLCDYNGDDTLPAVRQLLEPLGYKVTGTPRFNERAWGLPITAVPSSPRVHEARASQVVRH